MNTRSAAEVNRSAGKPGTDLPALKILESFSDRCGPIPKHPGIKRSEKSIVMDLRHGDSIENQTGLDLRRVLGQATDHTRPESEMAGVSCSART